MPGGRAKEVFFWGGGGSHGYHGELRGESVVANMQSVKGETVENECWRGGITGILQSPGKGGDPPSSQMLNKYWSLIYQDNVNA